MKIKISILSVIIILIVIVTGYFITTGFAGNDSEVSKTVLGYLETVTSQQWNNLDKYLTGEALKNAKINTQNIGKLELTLLSEPKQRVEIQNDYFAVIDVDFITIQKKEKDTFTSLNRQRLYVVKLNDTWKIYSIESLSKPIESANKTTGNEQITQVIKEYIDNVTHNDYTKAVSLLTGPVQEKGIATLDNISKIKNLKTRVNNLKITVLAAGKRQAYAKADYEAENIFPDGKTVKRKLTMGFDLENVKGKWYISKLSEIE